MFMQAFPFNTPLHRVNRLPVRFIYFAQNSKVLRKLNLIKIELSLELHYKYNISQRNTS